MLMGKSENRAAVKRCREYGESHVFVFRGYNGLWGGSVTVLYKDIGVMQTWMETGDSMSKLITRVKRRYNPHKIEVKTQEIQETHLRILGKWMVIRSDTSG
jgi:hypothetical protein